MKNFTTHAPFAGRFRVLCVLALVALVAACSSIKLAYNNGDTLLYYWMDAYLDLDSDQADTVKTDIDQLFQWHRKTQLKEYVQVLKNGQRQVLGNPSQADLLADVRAILVRAQALGNRAIPDLTDLARSVKPEQLDQMEKKFESNNDKFRKKFINVDLDKQQKLRYQKSMEQFELWFGGFSDAQEATLRKVSDARPLNNAIWLDERIIRQKKILSVLRKVQKDKLGKEATTGLIQDLIKQLFGRLESPERKAFYDSHLDGSTQMMLTAIKIATPEQKAHAQKRMQGWIDDFNALATQNQ